MERVSYVVHMPGHKDSKGNPAPWVIKSHETGEILSSHPTQDKAKEHLQQMHAHAGWLSSTAGKGFDGKVHKFSSTQVQIPADMARQLVELGMLIDEADLYNDPEDPTFGREDDAHITVQFGLHTARVEDVAEVVRGFGPIKAELVKVSMFENADTPYDVLKFDVSSPDLHRLRKAVNSDLEVTDTHPKYHPHATIAYVIKGTGCKYTHGTPWADKAEAALCGKQMDFYAMMFSGKDRVKTPIQLAASWLAVAAADPSYQVGDRVEISRRYPNPLMQGEAGIITSVRPGGADNWVYDVLIDDSDGNRGGKTATVPEFALESAEHPMRVRVKTPTVDELETMKEQIRDLEQRDPERARQLYEQYEAITAGLYTVAASARRRIYVGVSGFNYKSWAGTFYPESLPGKQRLAYLAERFPTVEMSSTFHQMPEVRVLKGWDRKTPAGFVMAFRGPKEVSHVRRMGNCADIMSEFCRRVSVLGDKIGPIGFQLPESFKFDRLALEAFLDTLPGGFRYALEFRNETWYTPQTYELLNKHDVALVTVSHSNMGIHPVYPASWSCFRMSGHDPDYSKNCYTRAELMNWRGIITHAPEPAFVYFNNEYSAFSAKNANTLIDLMGLRAQSAGVSDLGNGVDPAKYGPSDLITGPNNSDNIEAVDADDVNDHGYRAKDRGNERNQSRELPDYNFPFYPKLP